MVDRKETIEELNDVLEKTFDSIKGFKKVAEKTDNNRLMSYFNAQAITRKGFADALAAEVRTLGGEPKTDGTIEATMHRAWIDFKTALTFEKDEDLLEACITGEKNCIGEYDDLLEEENLQASTRALLTKQKANIVKTLAELKIKEERHDS